MISITQTQTNVNSFSCVTAHSDLTLLEKQEIYSHDLYAIQLSLNATGRGKDFNACQLFYRICRILHGRPRAYRLKAAEEGSFMGTHRNTIGSWVKLLVGHGLVSTASVGNGLDVVVTGKGWSFLNFVRDGVPLCITQKEEVSNNWCDAAIVQPVVHLDSPTLYTDHPKPQKENILLKHGASVHNLVDDSAMQVVNTHHINVAIEQVQVNHRNKGYSRISHPNLENFRKRLEKEGIKVETFLFAMHVYTESNKQFDISNPLGFIIDQCVKDRNVQRLANPEPIDDLASKITAELMRALKISDPTIENFEDAFNTVRTALECNQYN